MSDDKSQWQPRTRPSLIQRLGNVDADGQPAHESQWVRDAEDFQRTYLPEIERLMLKKLQSRFEASTEAGSFLGHVFEHTISLRNWDPNKGRFRDYLIGWLRNYQLSSQRENLSHEHRTSRGASVHELDLSDEGAFLNDLAMAHEQAWVASVTTSVLERFRERDPDNAWIVARHYGIALPGDPASANHRWPFLRIAKRLGLSEDAARRRKDRSLPRLRKLFDEALGETATQSNDLANAWERLFGIMAEQQPDLRRDLDDAQPAS